MERNPPKGRGAGTNPRSRFEALDVILEGDEEGLQDRPRTIFIRDHSKSVLSRNQSPDIPFDYSLNPYRGCEHGCAYCYARPTHEYLGLSAGLDFETRILVKEDAPRLLREALARRSWRPQAVALSGVTDPYQPVERRLHITRGCLEVFAEALNPVIVVTKNHLVTRDLEPLRTLAAAGAAGVMVSIPTLDSDLARVLEPRATAPPRRLEAIARLSAAGVPVGVLVAPVIPGLTDHEIPEVLDRAAKAGARSAGFVMLRLPWGLKTLFEDWLHTHRPERAERVLSRIRDVRDGSLTDNAWGRRQRGTGTYARHIAALFNVSRARSGLAARSAGLSAASFRRPHLHGQASLF